MRLTRFRYNGDDRVGALADFEVIDLQAAYAARLWEQEGDRQAERVAAVRVPHDLLKLFRAGSVALEACREALDFVAATGCQRGLKGKRLRYSLDEVALLLPYRPETALFAGPNADPRYAERLAPHLEMYLKAQDAFVGSQDALASQMAPGRSLGAEVELGVIIGKPGRYIAPHRVMEHILGYTVVVDLTDREELRVGWEGTMWHVRYAEGASFDGSAALGPSIVTADEVPRVDALEATLTVNGAPYMHYRLGQLRHTLEEFVAYCSTFFTLEPGVLVSLGSPGGPRLTVDEKDLPVIVKSPGERDVAAGDSLVATIGGIGTMCVSVGPRAGEPWGATGAGAMDGRVG